MHGRRLAGLMCVAVLCLAARTSGQSLSPGSGAIAAAVSSPAAPAVILREAGRTTVRATRISQPIRVDGRLDDRAYSEVEPVGGFVQQEPQAGAQATEPSDVWVLFDDDNIYITCRCWDSHPERIVANDMRRDSPNLRLQDNFAVGFDTFHDLRNGYVFSVSPVGGINNLASSDERTLNMDWNTVFDAKAGRFDGGWVAEIIVPFKSLRYGPGREQVWGIQFRRSIRSKNEHSYLTPVSAAWATGAITHMSVAATLVGIEAPRAAKNLELKPYAIASLATDLLTSPARTNEIDPNAGFDLKYGVTRSMTADFTYRTDFAQVEADEAQVNLTRFSLSLPEKREFFLEGRGRFTFGGTGGVDEPSIFYSRRIGLSGGRSVPIVAGGRLNGKAGKWNLGALNIETDDEPAARAQRTNFSVLSLRRDVFRRSVIGMMFTGRSVSTVAAGTNQVAGVEGQFAVSPNVSLNTFAAKSWTSGLAGDDLSYRGQLVYNADRYGLQLDRLVVGDNFNPEVGFLRREDFRRNYAYGRFSPRTRGERTVRKFYYEGSVEYTTDNHDRLETREWLGTFRAELQNSDAWAATLSRSYDFIPQPFAISEGVRIPVGGYNSDTVTTSYTLGQQHQVSGTASVDVGTFYGGQKITSAYQGRLKLTPRFALEPNISLNWIDIPQARFTGTVVGSRATYTMTPRMYAAALVQYSSSTTSVSTNVRFRWEYQPGSEVFVVYSEGRDTLPAGPSVLETRGVVVKFNRLFRF